MVLAGSLSCKKKSVTPSASNSFQASVAGSAFGTSDITVSVLPAGNANLLTYSISATNSEGALITLEVVYPKNIADTGSFLVPSEQGSAILYGDAGVTYSSNDPSLPVGEIHISLIDSHEVQGTFYGTVKQSNASQTLFISNGNFSVSY